MDGRCERWYIVNYEERDMTVNDSERYASGVLSSRLPITVADTIIHPLQSFLSTSYPTDNSHFKSKTLWVKLPPLNL